MKLYTSCLVLMLGVTASAQSPTDHGSVDESQLDAFVVLEQARLEAIRSDRNLFVHLEAPW